MSDAQKPAQAPASDIEEEEVELEYRPFVKYVGLGLAAMLVLGSGYATYALGYRQGYESGISSGQVESAINAAAVQGIAHLLQSASADDTQLLQLAEDTKKSFAWINDSVVRKEAEWMLGCVLLQRKHTEEAISLFRKLFEDVPTEPIWCRRSGTVAESLLNAGVPGEAKQWYRKTADMAKMCSLPREHAQALEGVAAVCLSAGAAGEKVNGELNALLREAEALGDESLTVRAMILAHEGERLRHLGRDEEAGKCFASLLKLLPGDTANVPPAAMVCFGLASMETGHPEQAEQILLQGEARLGISRQDTLCRLLALRHLATLAQNKGDSAAALALLNRAEGAATGRVAADEPFWNCLFVQKGWLAFLQDDRQTALECFSRALNNAPLPAVAVQAQEGAGRCYLDNQRGEDASRHFSDCLQLRLKHFASDTASLGRLALLHAHARDAVNMPEQAAELFAKAAEWLQGDAPEVAENRCMALLGHAHALFRAEKWEAALAAWEKVLPLLADKPEQREEAARRMQDCRSRLHQTDPDFTADFSS